MAFWNRRRSIDAMLAPHDGPALKKTLGWPHLWLSNARSNYGSHRIKEKQGATLVDLINMAARLRLVPTAS